MTEKWKKLMKIMKNDEENEFFKVEKWVSTEKNELPAREMSV
jgi:hypothetical protein